MKPAEDKVRKKVDNVQGKMANKLIVDRGEKARV